MQNFHFSSHAPSNRRQRVFPRRFYINPSSPNVLFTESTSPKNLPIVVCLSIPNRLILDRLPLIVVPRRSLFFLLSNPAVLSSTAASFLSNPAVLSSTAASFQSNPAVLSSTAASSHSNPRPRRSSPMSRQSLVYSSISHLLSSTQRFLPSIRSRFSLHLSRHSRQIMLPKRGLFHFVPLTLVVSPSANAMPHQISYCRPCILIRRPFAWLLQRRSYPLPLASTFIPPLIRLRQTAQPVLLHLESPHPVSPPLPYV
jgi:hypothetical protein